ncbi:hypothetical protein ADIS_4036 [Lunatimonas lonarensis]|uniref:Uncharacterized protein n=1 Tax=Lunatimonas lonarensis TaxID=1232681 RepID=R7ZN34_9BACT|nr:hypothetical protein ADIS_4036 [Lunatimonas lonarensis]
MLSLEVMPQIPFIVSRNRALGEGWPDEGIQNQTGKIP